MLTVIKWGVNQFHEVMSDGINTFLRFALGSMSMWLSSIKPMEAAAPSHKSTTLVKTLSSSPSRSSSCPLQICCHCGCWWCTWPKWTVFLSNQKSSVERGSLRLPTPSPATCTAGNRVNHNFPCWTSLPVAIFHEMSSRLPPRDSQRSQELMLLIGTRRGINLCSNELGIPQRGRFRRAPWHIYCYCRSIPFATNFKSYAYIIHIYILYILYDLYIYIFICTNIRMHTYAIYMRIHFSTKLL